VSPGRGAAPGAAPPDQPAAVLLDRDGTLNVGAPAGSYVLTPEALVLLPGVAAAVRRLNDTGVPVHVVTNQRGVALGLMSEGALQRVHGGLAALLAREGAWVDGIHACVHEVGSCGCRKPLGGLAERVAVAVPGLDLGRCVVVGDSPVDVGLARAVGARAVRLAPYPDRLADLTVPDLPAAVEALLGTSRMPARTSA